VIDPTAVARWLGAPVVVLGPAGAGRSKETLRVLVGGAPAVLSASVPGLPTAHDLSREHRFLTRLAGTGVPVPDVLGFCADPEVAGAAFLVTAELPGVSAATPSTSWPWCTGPMPGAWGLRPAAISNARSGGGRPSWTPP
jgi:aminoglycoside phosphotransferase (APT) family kinase protein